MPKIEIKGLEELEKKLKQNVEMRDVARVVATNGQQLANKMNRNADFAMGYQTGTTKRSIFLEIADGGFTAEIGPGDTPINEKSGYPATEYAPYVEYGTRFMDAQPFVRPAYKEQVQKFKRDIDKLVK